MTADMTLSECICSPATSIYCRPMAHRTQILVTSDLAPLGVIDVEARKKISLLALDGIKIEPANSLTCWQKS